jgi:hypothetical protein
MLRPNASCTTATSAKATTVMAQGIVKDVRGSESNCEHDSREM